MNSLELISNILCPFTQRAGIQLLEKQVPFKRTYIDLADKPAWFMLVSPLGKVPVLRSAEGAIFETSVICEYIEEVFPHPLHPRAAFERAQHRGWIEFASAAIADVHMFYTARDEPGFMQKVADLNLKMNRLEQHLKPASQFFSSDNFQLVDAAFAPLFRLFDTFDTIADFGICSGCEQVLAYRHALQQRASVRDGVVPDYDQHFRLYLKRQHSYLSGLMAS